MRGPKRPKRLYRVVVAGVSFSVFHYQDKRSAFRKAQTLGRNGLTAEVYESPIIEFPEKPIATMGG